MAGKGRERGRGRPLGAGREPRGIASVEKALEVLQALAEQGAATSLGDLAAASGMPPAKLHRYLVSFVRTGMVFKSPVTGLYDLGPAARRIGAFAFNRFDGIGHVHERLAELRGSTGQTLVLYVWTDNGATVVRWEPGLVPLPLSLRVGSTVPLARSATGRVFLAFLPKSATAAVVTRDERFAMADGLPRLGRQELARQLATVRKSGISAASDGIFPGVEAVAVPVFDVHGELLCVVTALAQKRFLKGMLRDGLKTALRAEAEGLSRELGYRAAWPAGATRVSAKLRNR